MIKYVINSINIHRYRLKDLPGDRFRLQLLEI